MINILDKIEDYKKTDKNDLLKIVENFPSQCNIARNLSKNLSIKEVKPEHIIISGMGGSGIRGELIQSLVSNELKVPLLCYHHYDIPEYVNQNTLAIIVSYSGNTEETLRTYDELIKRNSNIIAITSGGLLMEKCIKDNVDIIKVPSGYQPRAAVGILFFPILYSLYKIKVIKDPDEKVINTIKLLETQKILLERHVPIEKNRAKDLALKIYNTIPIIYASSSYLEPVARRWKCQINENAKLLSSLDVFPELCHNTICGWDRESNTEHYSVIILRSKTEDKSTEIRINYLKEIIKEKNNFVEEVVTGGENKLEEMFSSIYFGDFVSMYLSLLRQVNPSTIDRINTLKERLK